jgi:hypothetical protein
MHRDFHVAGAGVFLLEPASPPHRADTGVPRLEVNDLAEYQGSAALCMDWRHSLQNSLLWLGTNKLHAVIKFVPSVREECRMDIGKVLQGAEDEPAGIVAR